MAQHEPVARIEALYREMNGREVPKEDSRSPRFVTTFSRRSCGALILADLNPISYAASSAISLRRVYREACKTTWLRRSALLSARTGGASSLSHHRPRAKLQIARRELTLEASIKRLDPFNLLILDDLSYVGKDQAETSVLFEFIGVRYERRSTLMTVNQPFGGWEGLPRSRNDPSRREPSRTTRYDPRNESRKLPSADRS